MEKVTNKIVREYLGHNGVECKVTISKSGEVYRRGSPNPTDRSSDYLCHIGDIDDIKKEIVEIGYKPN